MSGFKTPIRLQSLESKLAGQDRQTLTIARNRVLVARLTGFIDDYVLPDTLSYAVEGEEHTYQRTVYSALGKTGTLLHLRQHEYPITDVPPEMRNLVVIDSLSSSEPVERWNAWSTDSTAGPLQQRVTTWDMGYPEEYDPGLQPVPEGMSEQEWQEEQELLRILEQEALLEAAPQVQYNGGNWTFRQPDGTVEPLRDIHEISKQVALATSLGLAKAAILPVRHRLDTHLQPTGSDE